MSNAMVLVTSQQYVLFQCCWEDMSAHQLYNKCLPWRIHSYCVSICTLFFSLSNECFHVHTCWCYHAFSSVCFCLLWHSTIWLKRCFKCINFVSAIDLINLPIFHIVFIISIFAVAAFCGESCAELTHLPLFAYTTTFWCHICVIHKYVIHLLPNQ